MATSTSAARYPSARTGPRGRTTPVSRDAGRCRWRPSGRRRSTRDQTATVVPCRPPPRPGRRRPGPPAEGGAAPGPVGRGARTSSGRRRSRTTPRSSPPRRRRPAAAPRHDRRSGRQVTGAPHVPVARTGRGGIDQARHHPRPRTTADLRAADQRGFRRRVVSPGRSTGPSTRRRPTGSRTAARSARPGGAEPDGDRASAAPEGHLRVHGRRARRRQDATLTRRPLVGSTPHPSVLDHTATALPAAPGRRHPPRRHGGRRRRRPRRRPRHQCRHERAGLRHPRTRFGRHPPTGPTGGTDQWSIAGSRRTPIVCVARRGRQVRPQTNRCAPEIPSGGRPARRRRR